MTWFTNGIIAAVLLGTYNFLYGLLQKNVSTGSILIGVGSGIVLVGLALSLRVKKFTVAFSDQWWLPIIIGVTLGLAIIFVVRSFGDPKVSVSQLVPLLNTNTLFSILLGLVVLKEYQTVSFPKLVLGAFLILLGAVVIR